MMVGVGVDRQGHGAQGDRQAVGSSGRGTVGESMDEQAGPHSDR